MIKSIVTWSGFVAKPYNGADILMPTKDFYNFEKQLDKVAVKTILVNDTKREKKACRMINDRKKYSCTSIDNKSNIFLSRRVHINIHILLFFLDLHGIDIQLNNIKLWYYPLNDRQTQSTPTMYNERYCALSTCHSFPA